MSLASALLLPGDHGRYTAFGLAAAAILMTMLAIKLAPASWRPTGRVTFVVVAVVAYVAHRVGVESGLSPWLDHHFLEHIGGRMDHISYWFVALLGALGALAALRLAQRRR